MLLVDYSVINVIHFVIGEVPAMFFLSRSLAPIDAAIRVQNQGSRQNTRVNEHQRTRMRTIPHIRNKKKLWLS